MAVKTALPARKTEPKRPGKTSTQQRVLDVSIELFNLYGVEAVSIHQISEALNISPGNLTYHYNKKSDLAAEHLSIFEDLLNKGVRNYPPSQDPHAQVEAFNSLMRLSLRYRFLFVGANFILQYELIPAARYVKLIAHTKRNFIAQIRRLSAAGVLLRIAPPNSAKQLIDSIWTQWLGSVLDAQIRATGSSPNEDLLGVDISIMILFLLQPHMEKPFFERIYAELLAMQKKAQRKK